MLPGLLAALGASAALAQEVDEPWYVGRTVAYVRLDSESGDLPEDDLSPLLHVSAGMPLSLGDVRHDIEVLMLAGQFESVEAVASPWPLSEDETGVELTFRIVSPPRIRRVTVSGDRGLPRQIVRDTLALTRGAPFYADEQVPLIEVELHELLADAGWPDAGLSVSTAEVAPGVLDLVVALDAGEPRRYETINLIGDLGVSEDAARRALRRVGIAPGKRVDRRKLVPARDALRDLLTDGVRPSPFAPHRQWLEARVRVGHEIHPDGDTLNVFVEAGPGLEIDSRGRGAPRSDGAAEALQLFAGDRVTVARAPEIERDLADWFHSDGYRTPTIDLTIVETDWGHRVRLRADRGPLHRLGRIRVRGATEYTEAYLASALREAAPETLRRGFVTDDGVAQALRGVEEFYRGQGFFDVTLAVSEESPDQQDLAPWRRKMSVDVDLVVLVSEGPRTWLRSLEVDGGLGLEDNRVDDARAELVGDVSEPNDRKPLIQARLDSLRQDIAERYRSAGYLNADVRLSVAQAVDDSGLRVADAVFVVESEEQVTLRSVVVQGNLRTNRDVIVRELALDVGEPITPDDLAQSRRQLYELGLFRVVSPELIGDDPYQRDLIVHLEERPNIFLEGGGGVSTDQGIRATGRAVHRNIGGLGWRVSALGQIGYGWEADSFVPDVDEPIWRAALRYEANGLPSQGQRLIIEGLLNETTQEPAFRISRRGMSVGLQVKPRSSLEALFDYRAQWRQLEDVEPGALVAQDPWYSLLDDPTSPTLPSAWRYQGGPGVQLLFDRRDDRFNPSRGGYALGRAEMSDAFTSGLLFFRLNSRGEMLIPMGFTTVRLGYIGGIGVAGNGQTLPLEDRFFLGGADSLRGFALNTVGPANLTPRPEIDHPSHVEGFIDATSLRDTATLWAYTGGDTMLAGSLEFRTPLSRLGLAGWDTTQLVTFVDVGQVWFRNPDILTESGDFTETVPAVRVGTGIGLRLATPIGPASLELGINPARLASRQEDRFVPHISLGAL